ncbi:nuclear transport factor 2 family protein [Variovorax sp. Sphag1AA]|uniref:nuclear transport factor 2 family protein n=1 Tax=Variovorax sp. Sphag1AA TaxID=2587027 RepID=UPI001616B8E1|nr:nuclear transport factor 2 family protein [Variovorax sp. Sphag1AA]MBB3178591.1 3-phenylpropionate/cinnamic acid dioxygenase small subunit [Variovorax sp. Sphag1AA]
MTADADIHAIERLQRRYAKLNDEARWHEVAELFTEDAHFIRPSDPDRPIVGRTAILQSFLDRPAGAPRRHLVANPEVELIDEDNARATCFSILLVERDAGSGTVTVGGFEDLLRRTADGWRFVSRKGFTDFDPVTFTRRSTDSSTTHQH